MSKLIWDESDKRYYENGVDHVVLYPMTYNTVTKKYAYGKGVAWNGVTNITENPEGAEPQDFYADNILYATLRSAEKTSGSITAYTYPDEFAACDGSKEIVTGSGIRFGQQMRQAFGLCYRTWAGNRDNNQDHYKLHILYGLTVSPSERSHDTINEDPELEELSWDFSGTPEEMDNAALHGFRPVGSVEIDTAKLTSDKLQELEDHLYGTATTDAALYLPDGLYDLVTAAG